MQKNIFSLSEKKFITGCEHSITFWALKFLILWPQTYLDMKGFIVFLYFKYNCVYTFFLFSLNLAIRKRYNLVAIYNTRNLVPYII